MTTIVLNWRLRYAIAPSWIASAISTIFGVPVSAASTPSHEEEPDEDRQHCGAGREDEPEPLGRTELEDLVTAFGEDGAHQTQCSLVSVDTRRHKPHAQSPEDGMGAVTSESI